MKTERKKRSVGGTEDLPRAAFLTLLGINDRGNNGRVNDTRHSG